MKHRLLLLLLGFGAALAGCNIQSKRMMADLTPPKKLPLLTIGSDKDKVVATVDNVPITLSELKWAKEYQPFGSKVSSVKTLLDALIIKDVLYNQAIKTNFYTPSDPEIKDVFKNALVARYLQKKFEEEFPPSKIPLHLLKKLYNLPFIKAKYNHKDIYRFYDIHWICCYQPNCNAKGCFDMGKDVMEKAYQKMLSEGHIKKEEIPDVVTELKSLSPKIGMQKLYFVYYWDKHEQRGMKVFDTHVVNAVIHLKVGDFSKPVRSAFGWHILYLWKHEPEVHKSFNDPDVQNDLRKFFYKKFQHSQFNTVMFSLLPWKKFGFLRKALEPAIKARKPIFQDTQKLYPVQIYDDAIDSVSAQTSKFLEGM